MDITDELKRKRTEFVDRLQEIIREQVEIQAQLAALDRVILIFTNRLGAVDASARPVLPRKARSPRSLLATRFQSYLPISEKGHPDDA